MKHRDTLQRFVFENAAIRGEIVHLDSAWRAVLERHDYPPAVRNLLGELMAAAVLLSAMLKFNGSMILQIQGNGPVNLLVVESTSERTLRGMAQWSGELASMPFQQLVGQGKFVITIDPREEGQRYQGIVSIEGETVSEALENYLARSEQIDSRLWLAADTEQAAGMLLQKIPAGHDADVDMWQHTSHLGATITRDELLELPARDILHRLYHEEDLRLFEGEVVRFHCSCTRERVVNVLRMLGYDEVRSIISERGAVDVDCEFCNQHFCFDSVDVEQVFAASAPAVMSRTRH